jgi:hypothetical protein
VLLSPSYSRARVGLAMVSFVLLSLVALLVLPAIFPAGKDLLAHYGLPPRDPRTQTLTGQIDNLRGITAVIALTALACGYWLALLRLRVVSGPQALLETIGLGILFFIGGEYVLISAATLISPDLGRNASSPFWWTTMLTTAPELLLRALALAIICGLVGTLAALLFTRWRPVRGVLFHAPVGVATFGRVLGVGMAALAVQLLGGLLLLQTLFTGLGAGHPGDAVFLLVVWLLAPALLIVFYAIRGSARFIRLAAVDRSAPTLPALPLASPAVRPGARLTGLGGALSTLGYFLPWCFLSVVFLVSSCNQPAHLETKPVEPSGADLAIQSGATFIPGILVLLAALALVVIGIRALRRQPSRREIGGALGAALIGLALVGFQSLQMASGKFPLTRAEHITFLGMGAGFWLLLIGFVIGVVGGGMMLYAVTRTRPTPGKKGITWADTGSARTLPDES